MQVIDDSINFAEYLKGPAEDADIKSAYDYAEQVKALFADDSIGKGYLLPWAKTNDHIRVRPGEVSIWAGKNGSGKSLMLSQVEISLMRQGAKIIKMSFEMKPARSMHRAVQQASGTSNPSNEYIDAFHRWTDGRMWMYDQQGSVKKDRVLAVARLAQERWGCDQVIIDSMMKCGIDVDDYNEQKRFINDLCSHAMDTGQHIHLVCHSKKTEGEHQRMGKGDIAGVANISDQVENIYLVWRNTKKEDDIGRGVKVEAGVPDATIDNCKQRNGRMGDEQKYALYVDQKSMSFVDRPGQLPQILDLDCKVKGEQVYDPTIPF
jgi:twinkle protein